MLTIDVVTTDKSRIFVAPNGANSLNLYDYHSSMVLGGLSKQVGEAENVTIPHPTKYRKFITVDKIITANASNWSTSLIGRFFLKKQSVLLKLFKCEAEFDLQCHFGQCVDPTDFNEYDLAIILENVRLPDYNTDPLGTLDQSGVAVVNETVAVSAENVYYIYNRPYNLITNSIFSSGSIPSLILNNNADCSVNCDDCLQYFGLKLPTALTGTDICIIYSLDGGVTWSQSVVGSNADFTAFPFNSYNLATDGTNVYVFLNETSGNGHMYKIPINQILDDDIGTPSMSTLNSTTVNAVFNEGKTIIAVGENATVQRINGNALTSELISNNAFTDNLHAVHGLSVDNFIAGGEGGLLLEYTLGSGFRRITITIPGPSVITETITALCMKNENEWLVGTHGGTVYITLNGGRTWTLAYQFSSCISSIVFPTKNVGYIVLRHANEIYRSIDAGASWVALEPNDATTDIIALLGIVPCESEPSKYVAYGVKSPDAFVDTCAANNELIPVASQTGIVYIAQTEI